MTKTIKVRVENGLLRPLEPLDWHEGQEVEVAVVEPHKKPWDLPPEERTGIWKVAGTLSAEDAEEMMRIIDEEFGQVDPRDWE